MRSRRGHCRLAQSWTEAAVKALDTTTHPESQPSMSAVDVENLSPRAAPPMRKRKHEPSADLTAQHP